MIEFTGERLVPGQVDRDLWNEHIGRYNFAARLARKKRVLDIACGLGYGSAELGKVAASVAGIDISQEAVDQATERYAAPNIQFSVASALSIPFPDSSFDLIVAFEVIEHLEEWPTLLAEARRLMAPGGQLIISTPNKSFYAETRRLAGPNPFHVHEFEFAEFREALREHFSSVTMFLQNHVAAISFQPEYLHHSAELAMEPSPPEPGQAHFFVAVCAMAPQTGAPHYLYLPASANVLKERETHIAKLEAELEKKDAWLAELKQNHASLLESHHELEKQKAEAVEWARRMDQEVEKARADIDGLRGETTQMVEGYESKIRSLEAELEEQTNSWRERVSQLETELASKSTDLVKCLALLDQAEALVIERTKWAQSLDARIAELESVLSAAGSSRWLRLGRKLGIGPQLQP